MSNESRRKLLKSIAAGSGAIVAGKSLPESWSRPVVDSVMLPAHAQTSSCSVAAGCYPAELIIGGNQYFQWPGGGPGPLTSLFYLDSACGGSDDRGSDPIVLARSAAEAGNLFGQPAAPISNVVYGGCQFYWTAPIPYPDSVLFDTPGSYTFTPPPFVTRVNVVMSGGGGAGGNSAAPLVPDGSTSDGGDGGNGVLVNLTSYDVSSGGPFAVVVGSGGVPAGIGDVGGGGDGGDSSFDTTNTADGGGGGSHGNDGGGAGTPTGTGAAGGAGGVYANPFVSVQGDPGTAGHVIVSWL